MKVAKVTDLKENEMKEVSVNGKSILLINSGGNFYAIDSRCSHMHLPLAKGKIDGNVITCAYHGSQFNITDGSVVHGPAKVSLKTYEVRVEGDDIVIEA